MHFNEPVIDDQNPFYCPTVTAISYLETLRRELHAPSRYTTTAIHEKLHPSFSKRLEQSMDEDDLLDLLYQPIPAARDSPDISSLLSNSLQNPTLNWERRTPAPTSDQYDLRQDHPELRMKRKRSHSVETFSDMVGPPKHERSFQSVNDDSFYLSAKAQRICYFPDTKGASSPRHDGLAMEGDVEGKIRALEDELYGPHIGTETPRGLSVLINHLDTLLPGIRLKERLYALKDVTHQHIADMLGADGHLNARILNILRTSEVKCLDLTASIMDEAGLNLGASDLLHVLKKPNSFLFVTDINLSDISLHDFDLTHIHHLPRLKRLWLSNTGIGNEAVFHLVALKRTLAELDLALNPHIDDDAIPALFALPKLRFVSLFDTSVRMPGLRRLAAARGGRALDIEVPRACEEYVDNMHRKYELRTLASLVVDPAECANLSPTALRRNLVAHAACNPKVFVGGTSEEMAERLESILMLRAADQRVREMVWKGGAESDRESDADVSVF
ncbi:hypothetical protein SCP_1801310 [Sparassis crispa]|uniref:Uncharacterized protein n=1 Tax=Sparassis crispa TaxID=139825 RepID=A0A401H6P0_9APHY|nr:hypothetical protein SCP_1801310 [Sparassis crispa]GBE90107.1 hypothetical protein SCP_1801310 [Sparassis crispa]